MELIKIIELILKLYFLYFLYLLKKRIKLSSIAITVTLPPVNYILEKSSTIGNKPFYNDKILKTSRILTNNWKIFRDEVSKCYKSFSSIKGDQFFEDIVQSEKEWTKLYIKWHSDIDKLALKKCPKTCKIINSLKDIKVAMFSVLLPGAKILPHCGIYKGCLRYHLGLITPNSDDCYISLNQIKYSWKDGEGILLDDTFEHWVVNNTNKTRIILFCDIVKPMNFIGKNINEFIINNLGYYTKRKN